MEPEIYARVKAAAGFESPSAKELFVLISVSEKGMLGKREINVLVFLSMWVQQKSFYLLFT